MEPRSAQRVLIAVDTNVLLELADEVEEVVEAFDLITALLRCAILLTTDGHLRGIPHKRLTLALQALDLPAPIIATPRELARKFLPR